MNGRRPGLQKKWAYVVNSLQEIIPSYELASSRISLFSDKRMRREAVTFAVRKGSLVLDLGSGPGTMARLIIERGAEPVLVDASSQMLHASSFSNRIQATFEHLPFRDSAFDSVVCGFALRDSEDLLLALSQVARVLRKGGRFGFCDLGKPDSVLGAVAIGLYMRIVPGIVGLLTTGRIGLNYASIYPTYVLAMHNSGLVRLLSGLFGHVSVHATQLGGSLVVRCVKRVPTLSSEVPPA